MVKKEKENLSHWPAGMMESVSKLVTVRMALRTLLEENPVVADLVYVGGSAAMFRAREGDGTSIIVFSAERERRWQLNVVFDMVVERLKGHNSPFIVRSAPLEGEPLISLGALNDWGESENPAVIPPRFCLTLQDIYRRPERVLSQEQD